MTLGLLALGAFGLLGLGGELLIYRITRNWPGREE